MTYELKFNFPEKPVYLDTQVHISDLRFFLNLFGKDYFGFLNHVIEINVYEKPAIPAMHRLICLGAKEEIVIRESVQEHFPHLGTSEFSSVKSGNRYRLWPTVSGWNGDKSSLENTYLGECSFDPMPRLEAIEYMKELRFERHR